MHDNGSNQDEKEIKEEPFQMEEGLSLNVLNNMMEETLIRDTQNSSSSQDEPSITAFKIAGIQEEKIKTFSHKFITAMNKVRNSLFSEAETLKFMNYELLQYEDYQKIFDQPSSFSYLSLPELGTVWILQIDSELALSLASIFRARRIEDQTQVKLSNHLDGALFFEIGPWNQLELLVSRRQREIGRALKCKRAFNFGIDIMKSNQFTNLFKVQTIKANFFPVILRFLFSGLFFGLFFLALGRLLRFEIVRLRVQRQNGSTTYDG